MPQRSKLQRDLETLATFIRVYCLHHHGQEVKHVVRYDDGAGSPDDSGQWTVLCPACAKLLAHALYKRTHCPLHPKPACKHCPSHCYHPSYRAQIREVMKFSGRHLVTHGRWDLLLHLLF
jgi:hypothetical protein